MKLINIMNQGGLQFGLYLCSLTAGMSALKLASRIHWSWLWVFSPLWLCGGIGLLMFLIPERPWLCRMRIHSWELLEERPGKAWNEYTAYFICRRCAKLHAESNDQWDQMGGM